MKTVKQTAPTGSKAASTRLAVAIPRSLAGAPGDHLEPDPAPSLEDLVRRLAVTTGAVDDKFLPRQASLPATGQILADIEVDGVRCLLIWKGMPQCSPANLSPREKEIVRMIAKGFPNKAIADVLDISPWTVGTHLRRIFSKLQVTCRAAMVAKLMDSNLDLDNKCLGARVP